MNTSTYSGTETDPDFVGPPTPWALQDLCDTCDGEGDVKDDNGNWIDCPECGGKGWVLKE